MEEIFIIENCFFSDHLDRYNNWQPFNNKLIEENFFNFIRNKSLKLSIIKKKYKNIYISRRTWIRKEKINIGEDNTQKRKCLNEDKLVELLINNYDYHEVFMEEFNMIDKIKLLENCENIICLNGSTVATFTFIKNKNIIILDSYEQKVSIINKVTVDYIKKYNNINILDFSYSNEDKIYFNMPFYINLEKLETELDKIYL